MTIDTAVRGIDIDIGHWEEADEVEIRMDENMAAPTSRWLLRRIGQKGHRFYYTGAGDKIFKTNEPTDVKVDETLAKNPFFDKYAAKINKLQQ